MTAEHQILTMPPLDAAAVADRCRAIAAALDAATALDPAPLKVELARRERELVALRDGLIARRRATAPDSDARAALTGVNIALSLLYGLEYPGGPLDRDLLRQAAAILRGAAD